MKSMVASNVSTMCIVLTPPRSDTFLITSWHLVHENVHLSWWKLSHLRKLLWPRGKPWCYHKNHAERKPLLLIWGAFRAPHSLARCRGGLHSSSVLTQRLPGVSWDSQAPQCDHRVHSKLQTRRSRDFSRVRNLVWRRIYNGSELFKLVLIFFRSI